MRKIFFILLSVFLCLSCGDDNDIRPSDIIVGNWTIDKYEILPEDSEIELTLTSISCTADNKFKIYDKYEGLAYEGDYEIGDSYIRMEYVDEEGQLQKILAEIKQYTETTLTIHYTYKDANANFEVTLWLKK